jgi:hypothetical protein
MMLKSKSSLPKKFSRERYSSDPTMVFDDSCLLNLYMKELLPINQMINFLITSTFNFK